MGRLFSEFAIKAATSLTNSVRQRYGGRYSLVRKLRLKAKSWR